MSQEQLGRLFQRFSQADESTTRKFGGTGLGLALTRAFARLLGGDVTVTSTEGQGTCFTLSVPVEAPEGATAPDDGTHPSNGSVDRERRDLVLVIDDEASQRELLTRFLTRQHFAVRTAAEGRSGLELARSMQPRVILLDVMMPDIDGWAVLKALKGDPVTAKIPVVIVSFVAEAKLGAALGAAETMVKPVDWAKLKALLAGFRASGGDVLVVDDDPTSGLGCAPRWSEAAGACASPETARLRWPRWSAPRRTSSCSISPCRCWTGSASSIDCAKRPAAPTFPWWS